MEDKHLGTLEVNSEGNIDYVNTLLAFLFGYTTAELVNKPLKVLLPDLYKDIHDF